MLHLSLFLIVKNVDILIISLSHTLVTTSQLMISAPHKPKSYCALLRKTYKHMQIKLPMTFVLTHMETKIITSWQTIFGLTFFCCQKYSDPNFFRAKILFLPRIFFAKFFLVKDLFCKNVLAPIFFTILHWALV